MTDDLRFDVIGLGYSAVDYIGVVPHLPELDTKLLLDEFSRQGGGPTATAMVTVARLGAKAAFVGQIGDDDLGDFALGELGREGVDTSRVIRREGASSQFSFIMVERSSGKRTILWTRSSIPPLEPNQLDRDFITSCKVLHLDRHEIRAGIQAAEWVHEAGGIVSMDAGTFVPGVTELMPLVDVLIASETFAREATGESDPAECARRLLDGRRIAGVTVGEKGSWFATSDGAEFHMPAFEVDVVDTNGAGDVFHGAFALGLARGWDARDCARFASAAAALKCTKLGGRAGIPGYEEVDRLMSR
jgi:sulfofructose kinase